MIVHSSLFIYFIFSCSLPMLCVLVFWYDLRNCFAIFGKLKWFWVFYLTEDAKAKYLLSSAAFLKLGARDIQLPSILEYLGHNFHSCAELLNWANTFGPKMNQHVSNWLLSWFGALKISVLFLLNSHIIEFCFIVLKRSLRRKAILKKK